MECGSGMGQTFAAS